MLPTLTRRQMLIAAAGLAVARVARAAAPARIGFGFSLYGMKSLSVSEALKVCADIGYSGVELACLKDWPADPARLSSEARKTLRAELQDLDLELPCLMENLVLLASESAHQDNLNRLKAVCELAHDLVPDAPPVIETVLGGKPADWPDVKMQMVDRLRTWQQVAASRKTVLAIKAHAFGALHTPGDAIWLAQQLDSPWIRLVYDFSHFQRQNLDLRESLALMLPQTVFVHIKDNRTVDGKTEFALPGDGQGIDYVAYLKQLRVGGYRGSVVVEVSAQVSGKPGYDPVAAARHCYQKIQPAFVQAGLRAEL